MKKVVCLFLACIISVLCIFGSASSIYAAKNGNSYYIDTIETEDYYYSVCSDHIELHRICKGNQSVVTIPDYIDGKPVTVIGEGFHVLGNSRESAEKVIIGNNVKLIGTDAFAESSKLKTIVFSNSVKTIGIAAFSRCVSLEEISIGNNIEDIKMMAFENCFSLKTVSFNKKIKTINESAFKGCKELSEVNFPNSINVIGDNAFNGCTALKEFTLPKKIKYLGVNAFENTGLSNDSSNYKNGSLYCSDYLLKYNPEATGKVTVAEGTVGIGAKAFDKTKGITCVKLPASVKYITSRAFNGMKKLRSVSISKSNKYFSSKNGVLYNKSKTRLVRYPAGKSKKSFTVPKSVKIINSYAFYKSDSLKKVVIPKNVKTINSHAFDNCKLLKKVVLNNGIKKIGKYAFYRCKRIKAITIPKSVNSIGNFAIGYDYVETAETEQGQKTEFPYGYVTVRGYKKSAAQRYCKDGGGFDDWHGFFKFVAID